MNNLLLKALRCENEQRPPVWFMRQAGRFLPEYRQLRQSHSLIDLFHTPELAALITEMPLKTLGVDAAILFSDILVITEVLGYQVHFPNTGGIELLSPATPQRYSVCKTLHYVRETILRLKEKLDVPLIGFCGGPFTVAKYMGRRDAETLQRLTDASIEYLEMQIDAGVDAIQIFDSWAGELGRDSFLQQAYPYLHQIIEALRFRNIPIILFTRGSCRLIPELCSLNPTAISFDWELPLAELRKAVPSHIAVQGNLNPEVLLGSQESVQEAFQALLESLRGERGFIVNLGHGVLPKTDVNQAFAAVQQIKYF